MIIPLEALKILLFSASYLLSLGQKQIGASQANIRKKEGCCQMNLPIFATNRIFAFYWAYPNATATWLSITLYKRVCLDAD